MSYFYVGLKKQLYCMMSGCYGMVSSVYFLQCMSSNCDVVPALAFNRVPGSQISVQVIWKNEFGESALVLFPAYDSCRILHIGSLLEFSSGLDFS